MKIFPNHEELLKQRGLWKKIVKFKKEVRKSLNLRNFWEKSFELFAIRNCKPSKLETLKI